ncbi:unnamed protein product [Meloidogyne enterolobii]|uniref:Uncharacterized protein n=1 Tax=Meloidogyne enterolobii TaxID=390850 RepID=A0ACB0Y301_MELEN
MLTHKLRRRVTRFGERPRDIRQAGFLLEGKPITYEDLRFERALAYNLDISNEIVVGTPKVIERNSSSLSSYSSSDQNKKLLKRPRNKKSKKKAKNTWAEDEAVAKELQRFNNEFDEIDDFQLLTEEAPRDFYVIKKRKRTTPKELQQINEPVVTAESSLFFSKQDSTQFTLNDTPLPPQQQQEENLSANISDENEIVPESPILNNSPIFKDIQEQQQFASISLKSPTLLEETTQKTIPSQVFTLDSTESVGIVQNVDVQSLSTAKEVSQNLTEKSSIICSSTNLLPPKRIFSSICEEKGNAVVDVIQLDSASSIQQISSKIQTRSMAKESSKICSSSNLLPKRIFSSISGSVQDKDEEVIQLDSSINQQPSSIHQSLSTAKESSKNLAQESSAISSITNLLPSRRIFSSINEEEEESREVIQLEDTSSIVQSKFNVFDSMRDSHHQTSLSLNIAKCPSNIKENILRDEAVPHSFASKKNLSQKDLLTSRGQQEHKSSENSLSFNLEVEVVEEGEYVLDEEENEAEKEEEEEMEEGEEEMEAGEDEVNDEEEMEVQKVEMGENEEEMEAGENELNGEEEEELEENEEEVELEDEEKEVECQEPSKSVEIQLVSTAKESSKNLSRKSSKLSSNLPPKRIFSSICEEVEEVQNVIQLDSASSIQQQSCSRIQQSLSTAKGLQKKIFLMTLKHDFENINFFGKTFL